MKQKPTKKCENGVQLRPASIEEAGLFYSELDQKQDEALGTVGHIRMDFGSGGKEFWHTWWPHNEDRFNTLEFKEELQGVLCHKPSCSVQSGKLGSLHARSRAFGRKIPAAPSCYACSVVRTASQSVTSFSLCDFRFPRMAWQASR